MFPGHCTSLRSGTEGFEYASPSRTPPVLLRLTDRSPDPNSPEWGGDEDVSAETRPRFLEVGVGTGVSSRLYCWGFTPFVQSGYSTGCKRKRFNVVCSWCLSPSTLKGLRSPQGIFFSSGLTPLHDTKVKEGCRGSKSLGRKGPDVPEGLRVTGPSGEDPRSLKNQE